MTPRRGARRSRSRDEHGAVAVVVAVLLCFVLLPVAAFVVDLGRQRVARSDVQAVADVVALDMARTMARGGQVDDAAATARALATSRPAGEGLEVRVLRGYVAPDAAFVPDQHRGCRELLDGLPAGGFDGWFAPPTSSTPANAVLVTVASEVGFRLTTWGGRGRVCQSAVASQHVRGAAGSPVACYDVGSYALAVRSGNAALVDPLLRQMAAQTGAFGDDASLSAVGYRGLASAQVDLDRLALALGLASVDDLATATVSLKTLLDGLVASAAPTTDAGQLGVLQSLAGVASTTATVRMDRLLGIGNGVPLGATMSALDLVGGALSLVNGQNAVSVDLATTLPGLSHANAEIRVVQGAHRFCGSQGDSFTDTSTTEQLRLTMTARLDPMLRTVTVPLVPGVVTGGTTSVSLGNDVDVSVSVAPTATRIQDVACTSPRGVDLGVTNGLAEVRLKTHVSNLTLRTNTLLGTSLSVAVSTWVEAVATIGPAGEVTWSVRVPPQATDTPYPSAPATVGLAPVVASSASVTANLVVLGVLGGSVALTPGERSAIVQGVAEAVVRPLLDAGNPSSLVNTALEPVLGLVGAQLGGSDLSLASVACTPSVLPRTRAPYLRG